MHPRLIAGLILALVADVACAADSCSVETRDVRFGIYDPTFSRPDDTSGSIDLRCDCQGKGCSAIHYSIAIAGGDGSGANRVMKPDGPSGSPLRYDLYSDPNRSALWGSGDTAVTGVSPPGHFGGTQQITVYARMPPLQKAVPGTYSDIAQVIVRF